MSINVYKLILSKEHYKNSPIINAVLSQQNGIKFESRFTWFRNYVLALGVVMIFFLMGSLRTHFSRLAATISNSSCTRHYH